MGKPSREPGEIEGYLAPRVPLESWEEPKSLRWTTAYLKRLLIERHGIRSAIENPGGSVITSAVRKVETDSQNPYSPVIGNDFHLDLLDAEKEVGNLDAIERARLLAWCDGLSPQTAAEFASVRPASIRMRQRTVKKLVEEHNEGEDS